jgi:putative flippase GtrA
VTPQPSAHPALLQRLLGSWATRSLALGAVATVLDLSLGTSLRWLGVRTDLAAMSGTTLGAVFAFFANRSFAFRDHHQPMAKAALKFVLVSATLILIHGQVVKLLCDGQGLPYPLAKVLADVLVITFNHPLLLRYFVFPKAKPAS